VTPKTYPEMNEKIKGILRLFNDPPQVYAAQRIEELESEVARLQQENDKTLEVMAFMKAEIEMNSHIESHGKWTLEKVWIYRNDQGDIMRAQDEHPAAASEEVERMYRSDAHESNHERL